jgi:hypothetical protein
MMNRGPCSWWRGALVVIAVLMLSTAAWGANTNPLLVGGPNDLPGRPVGPVRDAAPAPSAHLDYFGGRVVSNMQVIEVLWGTGSAGGSNGQFLSNVKNTTSPSIATFYQGVLNSAYVDWLTEYNTPNSGGTNQSIGRGSFVIQVAITPSNTANPIDDTAIQTELANQISAGHLPAPTQDAAGNDNTYYAIFFPHGQHITQGGSGSCVGGGFCAYHGTIANVGGHEIYYGVHPDMQAGSGCDTGCGNGTVFGNYTSVASHEMVETITDAEVGIANTVGPPLAWYDPNNGEIGDICNAQQGSVVGSDGVTYTVQKEFSNNANNCIVVTVSPTPTRTATATTTRTATPTATATRTATATQTVTATATATRTATATGTATGTATATATASPTASATATATLTATVTGTPTATATTTATATASPTASATATATASSTPTATPTSTLTATATATLTATATGTPTATATATATGTATATATASPTASATATTTATTTASSTPTATPTATATTTATDTATGTATATATATASQTASATATDTATATATATLTATATATSTATPSTSMTITSSLAFGNVAVGQTVTKNLTVSNTGKTNSLVVSGATPSDPEYAITGTGTCGAIPVTLAPTASCTMGVGFTPTAVGSHGATITINDNATTSPQHVTLSGAGLADLTTSTSSIVFGEVKFGSSSSKPVSVTNHQTRSVSLSKGFSGTNAGDFSIGGSSTCGATLAAKATCAIYVSFKPGVLGTESATLSIADSPDASSPHTVAISTGPTIPATVSPASTLAFGTLTTKSKTMNITVTDLSGFSLAVSEGSISGANAGDFAVTGGTCGGGTVSAHSTCTIAVKFTPTLHATAESANIAVTIGSDPNSPHNIAMTGTGP